MPTIPLITRSEPLPDLPDPVLDRERRPTVDNTGVMQEMANMVEASKMPLMSPDALSAPYEGLQSIGRAISDAGGVLGAYAYKKMEAESTVQVANAEGVMQNARVKFEEWKLKNPDTSTWSPEWQRRTGELKTELLEKTKLHNLAYNEIAPRLTSYINSSSAEVEMISAKATFAKAKDAIVGSMRQATLNRDKPAYLASRHKGVEGSLLTEKQAQELDADFDQEGVRQDNRAKADAATAFYNGQKAEAAETPALWRKRNPEPWKGDEANYQIVASIANAAEHRHKVEAATEFAKGVGEEAYTVADQVPCIEHKGMDDKMREQCATFFERYNPVEAEKSRKDHGTRNSAELREHIAVMNPANDPDKAELLHVLLDINTLADRDDVAELTSKAQRKYGIEPTVKDERPEHVRAFGRALDAVFDSRSGAKPWNGTTFTYSDRDGLTITEGNMQRRRESIDLRAGIDKGMKEWSRDNPQKARDPVEFNKKANLLFQETALTMLENNERKQLEREWLARQQPRQSQTGKAGTRRR